MHRTFVNFGFLYQRHLDLFVLLVKLLAVANQVLHQLIHLSKGGGVDGGELLRRSLERGQHRLEAPCLSVCPQLLADPSIHLGS